MENELRWPKVGTTSNKTKGVTIWFLRWLKVDTVLVHNAQVRVYGIKGFRFWELAWPKRHLRF